MIKASKPISNIEFSQILQKIKFTGVDKNPRRIGVAVSGGLDSIALCYLLRDWTITNGYKLKAFTVDHQLRDESGNEAKKVGELMRKLGIDHEIMKINWSRPLSNSASVTTKESEKEIPKHDVHPPTTSQLETNARIERYNLLAHACKQNSIQHLFIGHHLNDQLETLIMRFARGSGIEGLSAMNNEIKFPVVKSADAIGVKLVRPLLDCTKDRLRQTCISYDIPWFEDSTNTSLTYKRNAVRDALNKIGQRFHEGDERLGPLSTEGLKQFLEHMQDHRKVLNEKVSQIVRSSARFSLRYGICTIDIPPDASTSSSGWFNKHPISFRVLSYLVRWIRCAEYSPRLAQIRTLHAYILQQQTLPAEQRRNLTIGGVLVSPPNKNSGSLQYRWTILRQPFNKTNAFEKVDMREINIENKEREGILLWDNRFFVGLRLNDRFLQEKEYIKNNKIGFYVHRFTKKDYDMIKKMPGKYSRALNEFVYHVPAIGRETFPLVIMKNQKTDQEKVFSVPTLGIHFYPQIGFCWAKFRNSVINLNTTDCDQDIIGGGGYGYVDEE
ncbi:7980_t:CDS:2 [Ambispora leptoticha]|uniref:tRNA(Ile)-lysidine synthetase n=1 Tax=Ambispora leptoticha TaxID=144679 RepID=A0A9N9CRB0_9GLOM|nr:7980_t:CDS:2 [Ambispora leptoticha]